MNTALQDVFRDRSGGTNRRRILCILDERPQSDYQLARALDLNYKTIHHLSVLLDENLVRKSGEHYGAVYFLTDHAQHHWTVIEALARSSELSTIECFEKSTERATSVSTRDVHGRQLGGNRW